MGVVKFYTNHSNRNVVNKNIDQIKSKTLTFKDKVEILNPIIKVAYDSDILNCNYLYITEFNRYYFVQKTDLVNQMMIFYCHVDVLQTYKNKLKECQAIAARNGEAYDAYLTDTEYPIKNYDILQIKEFPFSFEDNNHFVLTVLGGA